MINAGSVQVKLFADTKQYMTAMTAAGNQMKTMGKTAQRFAGISIAAFAAFSAASAKMATDFDKRLREISTLIIGVTEKDIKNMSREIRDLANVTGKALDDIGKAKYDIISAGFTGMAESAVLLDTATRLAVGGVTSVTNSADLLTSALNSFQKSGFEAESAADVLFTTVRLGKTTMDELVGSVGRVFPTAKTLGASLADVGAAMATITAGGIKTYEAATYLNQAFTKLGAPSDQAAKAMRLYGIQVYKTEDGMLDLLKTIKQFQGYDLEQMRRFFPEIRAIKAVLAMANNLEFLERAIHDTQNAAGANQLAFEKMSKSWSVKLNKKVMQFKDMMIELGDKIMPTVVDQFGSLIDSIKLNSDKISKSINNIVIALGNIGKFLSQYGGKIYGFFAILASIKIGGAAIASFKKLLPLLKEIGLAIAAFPQLAVFTIAAGKLITGIYDNITGGIEQIKETRKYLEETEKMLSEMDGTYHKMTVDIEIDEEKMKFIKDFWESFVKEDKESSYFDKVNKERARFGLPENYIGQNLPIIPSFSGDLYTGSMDELDKINNNLSKMYERWADDLDMTLEYFLMRDVAKYIGTLSAPQQSIEGLDGLLKNMDLNGAYKKIQNLYDAWSVWNFKVTDETMKIFDVPIDKIKEVFNAASKLNIPIKDLANYDLSGILKIDKREYEAIIKLLSEMGYGYAEIITYGEKLKNIEWLDTNARIGLNVEIAKKAGLAGELDFIDYDEIENQINSIITLGDELAKSFEQVANSISATMANSFTEILLAGRVANQELEKYNKGLTNNFRTAAEIREDAWANMWNNILADTVRALLEIAIKYTILTGALMALDAISGGLLRGALGVSESVGGFWGGMADFFKSAGGQGFANTFGKTLGDGVITPSGEVVKTDPRDFIIATTRPNDLLGKSGSGGGGDQYYIYAMDAKSFEDYLIANPKAIARGVGNSVERRSLRIKTNGKMARAEY